VAGSGLVALITMAVARSLDVPGLTVSFSPLAFPSIPLLPVVGILFALVPALAAPNPVTPARASVHEGSGAGEVSTAALGRRGRAVHSDLSGVSA
jgi:hypothetical protein